MNVAVNANLILAVEALPMMVGFLLTLPFGARLAPLMSKTWPSLGSVRGRQIAGLLLVMLSGLIVSAHTWWIHERLSQLGGEFCASDGLFSCDDVIGHDTYGYAPLIGLPWGLVGVGVFTVLLYAGLVLQKEPDAPNGRRAVQAMLLLTGGGMGVILLLVSYEIRIEKLCQYCSTAHLANVLVLVTSWRMWRMMENGTWSDAARPDPK